jgi:Ca2+-binding RTX toxin-like protein
MGAFLMGCAVLSVVGCAGVRSEAPQKEQGHTEATASEEARCEGTRTIKVKGSGVYTTNDVPGCPKGGLLSGTDGRDKLNGQDGDDKLHGLGKKDKLMGAMGSDVIYGGDGNDWLWGYNTLEKDGGGFIADGSKDVLHGGPGKDWIDGGPGDDVIYGGDGNDEVLWGDLSRKGAGEDVIYGGDGNDTINSDDGNRDKINCGKGRDAYFADRHDYVDSSCEEEGASLPPAAGGAKDVVDCTNRTGKNAPRVCKSPFREQNAQ